MKKNFNYKGFSNEQLQQMAKEKHTFAICAYKDSPYLEECIKSVVNQEIKSNYILVTGTPSKYIENLTKKYNVKYIVWKGEPLQLTNWNNACENAETDLVTIAHQDDIYEKNFVKNIFLNYDENAIIYFSEYYAYKDGKIIYDKRLKIKKLLKIFLRSKYLSKINFFKKSALAFGDSICCPTITYNKKNINEKIFTSELKVTPDWDTLLKLSSKRGRFVFIPKQLIKYRIHDESGTKLKIINNERLREEEIMFNKFWPKWITKILLKPYSKAQKIYD